MLADKKTRGTKSVAITTKIPPTLSFDIEVTKASVSNEVIICNILLLSSVYTILVSIYGGSLLVSAKKVMIFRSVAATPSARVSSLTTAH